MMRTHGAPPKTADELKWTPPDNLKSVELDSKRTGEYRTRLHALGLNQKQYQEVMTMHFEQIPFLAEAAMAYGGDKLKAELLTGWKNEDVLNQNMRSALNVVKAFGEEADIKDAMGPKGNTPAWVYRILAKVGAEMGEDRLLSTDAIVAHEDLQALLNHPAYVQALTTGDTTHPEYARVKAKVDAHYRAQAAHGRLQRAA